MTEPIEQHPDTSAPHTPALTDRALALYRSKAFGWAIVGVGALLRVVQYLYNRSLWVDESYLALNIINREFRHLADPLFHNQAAPLGYLFLSKVAVVVFGTGEYALRLVPLAGGIAACALFFLVARRLMSADLAPVALGLFVVSDRLIYYASEIKQYSTDVAVTTALLLMGLAMLDRDEYSRRDLILFPIAGAAAIWLAHPAIFVLVGTGATLLGAAVWDRAWKKARRVVAIGAIWALSFLANYAVSLAELTQNAKHQRFWNKAFMPMPPTSGAALAWFQHTFLNLFDNPVGLRPEWFALGLCGAGCIWLFVRRRDRFFLLLSPIMLCLLASGLHKYPFSNRLLLYLVPVLILCTIKGVELFVERTGRLGPILGLALAAALVLPPSLAAARAVVHPRQHEEIKPVLQYVAERRTPSDAVYVYYGAQFPFQYYAPRYGFAEGDYTLGKIARKKPETYYTQLDAFRGQRRVWIIMSHPTRKRGIDEQKYFLEYLDRIGVRLDAVEQLESAAYLYDLGQQ